MSSTFNSTQVQDNMKDVDETDGPFDLSMTVVLFFMSILIVTSNSVTLLAICKNKGLKSLPVSLDNSHFLWLTFCFSLLEILSHV